ncbi:hypothetical protein [Mucilaginibacter sp.]|uniref:hypothetical protein n=1 Tax=Mucilaginibacter sp. TaxID=1882438 RepID=UPI0035BC59E1
MEDEFILFKKFDDAVLADTLIDLLEKHDIAFQVEETLISGNSAAMDGQQKHYIVKIHPDDVLMANQAITEQQQEDTQLLSEDPHLAAFTNAELTEVISQEDEKGSADYQMAQKILVGRGAHINDDTLPTHPQDSLSDLSAQQPKHTTRIIIGYFAALLGGVLGILIGWNLSSHKRLLPNGKQVYAYSEADRQQGRQITWLGIIVVILLVIYRIYKAL